MQLILQQLVANSKVIMCKRTVKLIDKRLATGGEPVGSADMTNSIMPSRHSVSVHAIICSNPLKKMP